MINIEEKVYHGENGTGKVFANELNHMVENMNNFINASGDKNNSISKKELLKAVEEMVKHNLYKDIGSVNEVILKRTSMGNAILETYEDNMSIFMVPSITNTGNVTIKINGLNVVSLVSMEGGELNPGILSAGKLYVITYNATSNKFLLNNSKEVVVGYHTGDANKRFKVKEGVSGKQLITVGQMTNAVIDELKEDPVFNSDDGKAEVTFNKNSNEINFIQYDNNDNVLGSATIKVEDANGDFASMFEVDDGVILFKNKKMLLDSNITFFTVYDYESKRNDNDKAYFMNDNGELFKYVKKMNGHNDFIKVTHGGDGMVIRVKSITTIYDITFLIDTNNVLWVAGEGRDGQLGLGDIKESAVFIDTGMTAKQVGIFEFSTYIIDIDNKVWVTGRNSIGELGLGDTVDRLYWTDTGKTAKKLSVGYLHACIIDLDDKVWATGYNKHGQLGVGDANNKDIWTDTGKTAKDLATSFFHTCIVDLNDAVWTCGSNAEGQLGIGSNIGKTSFTDTGKIAKKIYLQGHKTFIIDMNNKLWATGRNASGELGVGDYVNKNSFIYTGKTAKSVVASFNLASYVIDMNDELWVTGENSAGQLGLGHNNTRNVWTNTGKHGKALFIKLAYPQVFLIDLDDNIWTTGWNQHGSYGIGDIVDRNTFTDIGIKGKLGEPGRTSYVVTLDNSLMTCGNNLHGTMGVGDKISSTMWKKTGMYLSL